MWAERWQDPNRLLFLNMGLGQDSAAIAILYCQGRLPDWFYKLKAYFVFADTGAEAPPTYQWAREHFIPYLWRHGLELHWLAPGSRYHRTRPSANHPDGRLLLDIRTTYMSDKHPSFPMLGSGGRCTQTHKQGVLARFREERRLQWCGRTAIEQTRAGYQDVVVIGIAADETQRALPSPSKNYRIVYPLIDLGMDRAACRRVIEAAGLPVTVKSGCLCCPFMPIWQHVWVYWRYPEEFTRNEAMEDLCNRDRAGRGLEPVYMVHSAGLPLRLAVERWIREHPGVTAGDLDRWLIERECYSVHWGRQRDPNQLRFDLESGSVSSVA